MNVRDVARCFSLCALVGGAALARGDERHQPCTSVRNIGKTPSHSIRVEVNN